MPGFAAKPAQGPQSALGPVFTTRVLESASLGRYHKSRRRENSPRVLAEKSVGKIKVAAIVRGAVNEELGSLLRFLTRKLPDLLLSPSALLTIQKS